MEIRLEKSHGQWHFSYITDFCYVGTGYMAELAKDLDFDFGCGVFQNLVGVYPLEQARDIYPVWEQNFLSYCISIKPFKIEISTES